jgi:hypothetical protein
VKKLKNRKIVRYVVRVECGGVGYPPGPFREIERLNHIPVGKEVFLSDFYGGAGYWILRTPEGLQYMLWMTAYNSEESTKWLERLITA